MVQVPTFRRRLTPSARVGGVEIPTDIADFGAAAEAKGLVALGRGISFAGNVLLRLDTEQKQLLDTVSHIKARGILSDIETESRGKYSVAENIIDDRGGRSWVNIAGETWKERRHEIDELSMSREQREIVNAHFSVAQQRSLSRAKSASVQDSIIKGQTNIELLYKNSIVNGDAETEKDAVEMFFDMQPSLFGEGPEASKVASAQLDTWKREAERNKRSIRLNRLADAEREKIEVYDRNEKVGWKLWQDNKLTPEWLNLNVDNLSKPSRYFFTSVLDAEESAAVTRLEAEQKLTQQKDAKAAKRLVVSMINDGTLAKSSLDITADLYDFTAAEYEGFLRDLTAAKPVVFSYESAAELVNLIEGVREGVTDPEIVKLKIASIVPDHIKGGMEKNDAIKLALEWRFRLSAAIKARDDDKDPLKIPRAKIYADLLKDLYYSETVEPLEYDKMRTQLHDFFKQVPDASPEQASKFYEKLTGKAKAGFIKRMLRFGFRFSGPGLALRGISKIRDMVGKDNLLPPELERYNLSEQEKTEVKSLLERGVTIEQIVLELEKE